MSEISQLLGPLEPYLREYGYAAVFFGVFLESVGLPLPGESLVIAGALLASQGTLNIMPLVLCVWTAAVFGDNLGYLIGHLGGRQLLLRHGAKVGITEERLLKVEGFFARYGGQVVLFARFVVPLRQLNGLTAGTLDMHWRRFLFYNAVGGILWAGSWSFGVYFLGKDVSHLLSWARALGYLAVAATLIGGLGLFVFLRYRKRH